MSSPAARRARPSTPGFRRRSACRSWTTEATPSPTSSSTLSSRRAGATFMRHNAGALAVLIVAGLAACAGGGPSGPSYPPLAGTYATTFAATWTVTNYGTGAFGDTGSITLLPASGDGAFTGSYIDDARTGAIAGTERADGAIGISQFGNPNEAPLAGLWILHSWLPACDSRGHTANRQLGRSPVGLYTFPAVSPYRAPGSSARSTRS